MRAKLKTAVTVVVLTGLIWVFAERAKTMSADLAVEVRLGETPQDLLVRFLAGTSQEEQELGPDEYMTVKLTVEGPARRIGSIKDGSYEVVGAVLDVGKLGLDAEGDHQVAVLHDLFNQGVQLKDAGGFLTVKRAEPAFLRVRVNKLVKKSLPVNVYDQDKTAKLAVEQLEPVSVDAYVFGDQQPEVAVLLRPEQRLEAERKTIAATGQVALPTGLLSVAVQVKLAEASGPWERGVIQSPRLSVVMPYNQQLQYRVVIEDLDSILQAYLPIKFRGSVEAVRAYEKSEVHLELRIKETDSAETTIERPLHYHLPEGYDDIKIIDEKTAITQSRLEKLQE